MMTVVIYLMIMFGGFVNIWGLDHTITLRHYITAFGVTTGEHGLVWSGGAWNSFWTTIKISAISAPLTAGLGLLAAYLLVRQRFAGKAVFRVRHYAEFRHSRHGDRVSYVLAFQRTAA